MSGDVASLKTDVASLKTDVGKLLNHFGLIWSEKCRPAADARASIFVVFHVTE